MSRLEGSLRQVWRRQGGVLTTAFGLLLAAPSLLFALGVRVRNFLYDRRMLSSVSGPLPVVSIGNLAVGGTGKTPVAAWMAKTLAGKGWKPALVARGYGEDELLLHRRWSPAIPLFRAVRRLDGVHAAHGAGQDIVVLDDGFQHRALARDLDVVLLSPAHEFPPRLLPRGPFREPLRSLSRADLVLVTAKGEGELAAAQELSQALSTFEHVRWVEPFAFVPGEWQTLGGSPAPAPSRRPLVVASIAEPEGFRSLVEQTMGQTGLELLAFPDHHDFNRGDIDRIISVASDRAVATTEKDAVKLIRFEGELPECRVLPLVPRPPDGLAGRILNLLEPRRAQPRQG